MGPRQKGVPPPSNLSSLLCLPLPLKNVAGEDSAQTPNDVSISLLARAHARFVFVPPLLFEVGDSSNGGGDSGTNNDDKEISAKVNHARRSIRRRKKTSTSSATRSSLSLRLHSGGTRMMEHRARVNDTGSSGIDSSDTPPPAPLKYSEEPVLIRLWRTEHRRVLDTRKHGAMQDALLQLRDAVYSESEGCKR